MSSMLKKSGAGAFKPRAPIARRRPPPNSAAASSATAAQESTPAPSQDGVPLSSTAELTTRPSPPAPAQRQPEQPEEPPSPTGAEPATPSSAPDTPAAIVSHEPQSKGSSKDAAGTVKSGRRTAAAKATPSTDTTAATAATATAITPPEASSIPTNPPLPTPSADSVTPSIEHDEGPPPTAPTPKAKGKAKAQSRTPAAPKQPRKRKAAAVSADGDAETGAGAEGPAKKTKRVQRKNIAKKKATTTKGRDSQSEAEGGEDGTSATPKRRSQRTHKLATCVEKDGQEPETGTDNEEGFDTSDAEDSNPETTNKPKRPRRKRSVTPEDAENIQIDPQTITLAELTKNMRTGKRWDKAHLIEQVEQERKREMQKKRLIKLGRLKEGEELPTEHGSEADGTPGPGDSSSSTPAPAPPPKSPTPAPLPSGPQMRVVNGVMVVDETTTQYDRFAEADAARETYESKEEHEFSRRTTQRTNMTRKPQANFWGPEETDKFYHGLRMFGTDFGMIAKMFGGAKSRRQVKLKFNREERANPVGVNKCIIGEKEVVMDLDAVGGGDGLEESADIKDELLREQTEREAQAKALEDEVAAEARRKREELMGKRKGDKGKGLEADADADADADAAAVVDHDTSAPAPAARSKGRAKDPETLPGAKYGVGTDPDVIDETDLPAPATRGGRRGRGRGGRRGGKAQIFASGIGVD